MLLKNEILYEIKIYFFPKYIFLNLEDDGRHELQYICYVQKRVKFYGSSVWPFHTWLIKIFNNIQSFLVMNCYNFAEEHQNTI